MRQRDLETRYREYIRHQQKRLEKYAALEIEWAGDLLSWYRKRHLEIPDDQYRAAAFFLNREYLQKPGSLYRLNKMYRRFMAEVSPPSKELAFDFTAYRFMAYAKTLQEGGYD